MLFFFSFPLKNRVFQNNNCIHFNNDEDLSGDIFPLVRVRHSDVVLAAGWHEECDTCGPFPGRCGSWSTHSNLGPLFVKSHQVLERASLDNSSPAAIIPAACAPLPGTRFPSSQLSMNTQHSLRRASSFSSDLLFLNCQTSSALTGVVLRAVKYLEF